MQKNKREDENKMKRTKFKVPMYERLNYSTRCKVLKEAHEHAVNMLQEIDKSVIEMCLEADQLKTDILENVYYNIDEFGKSLGEKEYQHYIRNKNIDPKQRMCVCVSYKFKAVQNRYGRIDEKIMQSAIEDFKIIMQECDTEPEDMQEFITSIQNKVMGYNAEYDNDMQECDEKIKEFFRNLNSRKDSFEKGLN